MAAFTKLTHTQIFNPGNSTSQIFTNLQHTTPKRNVKPYQTHGPFWNACGASVGTLSASSAEMIFQIETETRMQSFKMVFANVGRLLFPLTPFDLFIIWMRLELLSTRSSSHRQITSWMQRHPVQSQADKGSSSHLEKNWICCSRNAMKNGPSFHRFVWSELPVLRCCPWGETCHMRKPCDFQTVHPISKNPRLIWWRMDQ